MSEIDIIYSSMMFCKECPEYGKCTLEDGCISAKNVAVLEQIKNKL